MQVTETKNEGLERAYKFEIPQAELQEKLDAKIDEIRPQMQLKGFRPGKVPASHIRRMFGKSIMGDIIQETMQEVTSKTLEEKELRPATQPHTHMECEAEKVIDGDADLEFNMHFDVLPDFEPADYKTFKITKPVAEITDKALNDALEELAEQNLKYDPRGKTAKARDGDAVVLDFLGKIDGEAFEGGKAENQTLVLGSGQFIPGFEEQLVGVKAGQDLTIEVTFPENYQVDDLKGKLAEFECNIHEIRAPKKSEIDEEFAKGLGLESLESLKDAMKGQLENQYNMASRNKVKRALLDELDKEHDFELPTAMVNSEFDQIWSQVKAEKQAGNLSDEDKDKSDEELEKEYREIAERRVRLGLVLAEIGRVNEITVPDETLQRALQQEAMRYPGQEQQIIEFYQKQPGAIESLRAPLFEEQVVDFMLEQVELKDKKVSAKKLLEDDE